VSVARGVLLLAVFELAACGEKAQTMTSAGKKSDAAPWTASSSANAAFVAPGWKAGDKAAWEEQMRQRNQAQNDYVR
jgi:hypothetical protein